MSQLFKRQGRAFHPLPTTAKPEKKYRGSGGIGSYTCPYCNYSSSTDRFAMEHDCIIDEYEKELAACEAGAIPIEQVSNHSETKEGEVYEVAKRCNAEEFRTDSRGVCDTLGDCPACVLFAVPVATNQSEEDLWEPEIKMLELNRDDFRENGGEMERTLFHKFNYAVEVLKYLQQRYNLTRKTPQP